MLLVSAIAATRMAMSKILVISPEKCLGCRSCELICSLNKIGEFNPGESAVDVLFCEQTAISVPVMCLQCENAACMKVCPVGAMTRNDDGSVAPDPQKCIVCKMCASACPMGNISVSSVKKKILKCDLCGGDPGCAKVCPSGAIQYVDVSEANIVKKKAVAEKFKDLFTEVEN